MDERNRSHRLFFALWPDEVTRAELAKLLDVIPRHRGKPVAVQNLHITLAFIGNVDEAMKQCLQERAEKVNSEPFSMTMTRLGYFRRAKVTWLGPETCPLPLQSLVECLNTELEACGHRPDKRPFSPHLTLFRKSKPVKFDSKIVPLHWQINRFCLVQSNTLPQGAEYRVLRDYPLISDGGDQRPKSV